MSLFSVRVVGGVSAIREALFGWWRNIPITLIDRVLKPESKQFCYGRVIKLPIPNGRNGNQKV